GCYEFNCFVASVVAEAWVWFGYAASTFSARQKNRALSPRMLQGLLVPGHGHGRLPAMAIAALVFRPVLEPVDKTHELLDGFFVGAFAFIGAGQFRVTQNTRLTVTAGPGDERRRPSGEKVHPIERAVLFVKADHTALDPVFAHVVTVQKKIQR